VGPDVKAVVILV